MSKYYPDYDPKANRRPRQPAQSGSRSQGAGVRQQGSGNRQSGSSRPQGSSSRPQAGSRTATRQSSSNSYDDDYSRNSQRSSNRRPPNRQSSGGAKGTPVKKKSTKLKVLIVFEVLLLGIVGFVAYMYFSTTGKVQRTDIAAEEMDMADIKTEGYVNIALFGVDSRDEELRSNTRSDTIIVVSINEKTKDVSMASFFRDTYSYVENYGKNNTTTTDDYTKITHAYLHEGCVSAIKALNQNYDLNINKFVTVNFNVLVKIVDLVGGLDINIKSKAMVDSINKYGKEVAKLNGDKFTNVTKTGAQHLDGYQVIGYARTRKIDSDYERAKRQREVIQLIFNKVKSSGFTTLKKIVDEVASSVYTNLKDPEIISLLKDAATYNIKDSIGFPYENYSVKYQNIYYVYSRDLQTDVLKLHKDLYPDMEYTMTDRAKSIIKHITSIQPPEYK